MLSKLLDTIDILGVVITADALHTQTAHADYPVTERGAHYLLTVKRNQPTPRTQLVSLPRADVPITDTQNDRGHGREGDEPSKPSPWPPASDSHTPIRPSRSPGNAAG